MAHLISNSATDFISALMVSRIDFEREHSAQASFKVKFKSQRSEIE